jgi:hypothetical protein
MKRIIAFLLCCFLLAGCAQTAVTENGQEDTPAVSGSVSDEMTPPEPEETNIPSNVPDVDLDGFLFSMLRSSTFVEKGVWTEELTGDAVPDAIYDRNIYLEDHYNCKLEVLESAEVHPGKTDVVTYVKSGDDTVDAVFDGGECIANLPQYYRNLNDLPYFSFDMPWWNKDFNEGITIAGKLNLTVGAAQTSAKQFVYHVIFDKTVAENYGIGANSFYEMVREGRWTLDRMAENAELVKSDLNGDGKYDHNDLWGLIGENYVSWTMALGAGFRCAEKDENDLPAVTFGSEANISIMDKVLRLAGNRDTALFAQRMTGVDNVWTTLGQMNVSSGQWLFRIGSLGDGLREMEDDYGVLPAPKYDENQSRYYHDASLGNSPTLAIPVSATDADTSALLMEAMTYESFYRVIPIFYQNYLETKLVRDEDSVEMLRIVHNSLYYDIGALFNWSDMRMIIEGMSNSPDNTLATKYAAIAKVVQKQIDKTVKSYLEG